MTISARDRAMETATGRMLLAVEAVPESQPLIAEVAVLARRSRADVLVLSVRERDYVRGYCASPIDQSLSFEGRTETIAAARRRLDHLGVRGVMLELEPQSLDEDAQVVALVAVGGPPHLVEQCAIVHDFVGMAGQLGHQQVLGRR